MEHLFQMSQFLLKLKMFNSKIPHFKHSPFNIKLWVKDFIIKCKTPDINREIRMVLRNLERGETCHMCLTLPQTSFCENALQTHLSFLDNPPDSDLVPPTHLSMEAIHTRYRRLRTTHSPPLSARADEWLAQKPYCPSLRVAFGANTAEIWRLAAFTLSA